MSRRDDADAVEPLDLNGRFDAAHGIGVAAGPATIRVTARNPSPFTFQGTNTYVVGDGATCVVVDPGPDDGDHLAAIETAVAGRRVETVLITHRHRDHTDLARRAAEAFAAPIAASRILGGASVSDRSVAGTLDAAFDGGVAVDRLLDDGDRPNWCGLSWEAVATPGHTGDHMAFALPDLGLLLSGDHVMAWSTTVIAPPEGTMRAYMASLRKLLDRSETTYLPGHGGPVVKPRRFVQGLIGHRAMREAAILERLRRGDRFIPDIVAAIYAGLDPRLTGAASRSVHAHLIHLFENGLVLCDAPADAGSAFAPA